MSVVRAEVPTAPLERRPSAIGGAGHVVQFYHNEGYLYQVVADYVADGLAHGQAAVLIATGPHRAGIAAELLARGIDVDAARESRRLALLDARETLATFMDGASPDRERFRHSISPVIEASVRASTNGGSVRLYGEMVDLLLGDGNADGAVRLEELWNDLAESHAFGLLCTYAMANFPGAADAAQFERICGHHTRVLPTERYFLGDEDARLLEISTLQQRAQALEAEISRRRELEAQLRKALTERERLLKRERAARAAAESANRAKGDFLAIMSHELRTPLNAIAGYAELLELGVHGPVTEAQRETLSRIQKSQKHLLSLITEVLSYTRSEAGKDRFEIADVAVDEVLRAADLAVLPLMRSRGLAYGYAGCDAALCARADRDRLQQIVLNLLTNAAKCTESGGEVRLECEADGERVLVHVRDTGIGIPADKLEEIFEPFFQIDTRLTRAQDGLGLGLAISRKLAHGMGGDIRVESRVAEGSTFTVSLQRSSAEAAPSAG